MILPSQYIRRLGKNRIECRRCCRCTGNPWQPTGSCSRPCSDRTRLHRGTLEVWGRSSSSSQRKPRIGRYPSWCRHSRRRTSSRCSQHRPPSLPSRCSTRNTRSRCFAMPRLDRRSVAGSRCIAWFQACIRLCSLRWYCMRSSKGEGQATCSFPRCTCRQPGRSARRRWQSRRRPWDSCTNRRSFRRNCRHRPPFHRRHCAGAWPLMQGQCRFPASPPHRRPDRIPCRPCRSRCRLHSLFRPRNRCWPCRTGPVCSCTRQCCRRCQRSGLYHPGL